MSITIVGAGMAGLLAANLIRKSRGEFRIVEAQDSLPNNHSAVLRFRTPNVGKAVGIPFKAVTMIKTSLPWRNPVADALAYSTKCNMVAKSDRSITDGLVVAERFIAPPDFIQLMAGPLMIDFGTRFDCGGVRKGEEQIVSTLPMPLLMNQLSYPRTKEANFRYQKGINVRAIVHDCDAYVTLMVPDPEKPFSRVSITGNELIVEVPSFNLNHFDSITGQQFLRDLGQSLAQQGADLFGLTIDHSSVKVFKQVYSKILPIDDDLRKDFIYWATHNYNIFSLGRFATWRPGLLLDDLLNDIELINRWTSSNNRYAVARHR